MQKNFNDEWDKLDKTTQEAVKKKTQEKIDAWYDPNKIKSHIEDNYSNSPQASPKLRGSENNITPTPKSSTSNSNTWTNTMWTGYKTLDIPWINPIDRNTNKKANNDSQSQWTINNDRVVPSFPKILEAKPIEAKEKVNNNLPKQKMTEMDRLMLDNIFSYNQGPKSVKEQNEIVRQRAERQNKINELQRQENNKREYQVAKTEKIKEGQVLANSLWWKTFTEEEWNKRQDNLKKKQEFIENVEKSRAENNWKVENSRYNDKGTIENKEDKKEKLNINIEDTDKFRDEFSNAWDEYIKIKEKLFEKKAWYWVLKKELTEEESRRYHDARDKAKELHYARNNLNINLPSNEDKMKGELKNKDSGWEKMPLLWSVYHQNWVELLDKWNTKYINVDWREVIYDKDWNIVETDENLWTFNFFTWFDHFRYDVEPYKEFWNTIFDSSFK